MKCIVKDCTNHSHQGKFIGELCSPCYSFITTGEGVYSQAYRNTVLAEREACAKVCEEPSYMQQRAKTSAECAAAIRARGNNK